MRITLTDEYYIETDPRNYILMRKYMGVSRKTNEPAEMVETCGYYGNLRAAIEGMIQKNHFIKNLDDSAVSIREYVNLVDERDKACVQVIYEATRAFEDEVKRCRMQNTD